MKVEYNRALDVVCIILPNRSKKKGAYSSPDFSDVYKVYDEDDKLIEILIEDASKVLQEIDPEWEEE